MSSEELRLIFIPGPGIGHIVSAIEVGKRMLSRDVRLSVTFLLVNDPVTRDYTKSSHFRSDPRLCLLNLPELEETGRLGSDSVPRTKSEIPSVKVVEHVDRHKPLVREAVAGMVSTGIRVVGFVADMFCPSLMDVADEFSIPSYVFFTSSAGFLSLVLYMQGLCDGENFDVTEVKDSDEEFAVTGFVNPVPAKVLPSAMLDKNGGSAAVMSMARRIRKSRGIFVNTFQELEPNIIHSLSNSDGDGIPPIYAVGPLLNLDSDQDSNFSDIIRWLDRQPSRSVVFLCFGSEGVFSEAQIKHLAAALESSRRRFLWSLRRGKERDSPIPVEILPDGFLQRTEAIGKVIGWAPQAAVLSHAAVGGFVSHCGWNSVLESLWYGVPMAAWPIYAEQQVNAFQVVAEIGVAVEVRMDFREGGGIVVGAEEIEAAIERLMQGGNGVRERAAAMREKSRGATVEGGSSHKSLTTMVLHLLQNSKIYL